ncbi:aldo/keto reductase [Clavibacter michiganensis]|uniref:aldo/keto reductase n=1 Tax=Clavibacter michiganensis TaxID=28447 RepID=UPI00155454AB|nr:aldo/keto reductase [Clavibacter michiganensis]
MRITTLGFGAWEVGGGTTWGDVDEVEAEDSVVQAAGMGVNWVDTAHVYGGHGGSERLVGRALRRTSGMLVSTKLAPEAEDAYTLPGMRRELEAGLTRLGRDRADVYLLHWPSESTPLAETWAAMDQLRQEGLVGSIGLSNYRAQDVRTCQGVAPVDVVQIPMNLLDVTAYDEVADLCVEQRIGMMTYGTLAYGLLARPDRRSYSDWRGGQIARDDFFVDENYLKYFAPDARVAIDERLAALARIAEDAGRSVIDLSIKWVLAQPGITAALAGTSSSRHALANVRSAMSPDLDPAVMAAIADTVRA